LTLLDSYTESRDSFLLSRVFRYVGHLRKHLPVTALKFAVDLYTTGDSRVKLTAFLGMLPANESKQSSDIAISNYIVDAPAASSIIPAAEVGSNNASTTAAVTSSPPTAKPRLPRPGGGSAVELEVYLWIQVLSYFCAARMWSVLQEGVLYLLNTILAPHNRRTLDSFQVRLFLPLPIHSCPITHWFHLSQHTNSILTTPTIKLGSRVPLLVPFSRGTVPRGEPQRCTCLPTPSPPNGPQNGLCEAR